MSEDLPSLPLDWLYHEFQSVGSELGRKALTLDEASMGLTPHRACVWSCWRLKVDSHQALLTLFFFNGKFQALPFFLPFVLLTCWHSEAGLCGIEFCLQR